VVVNAQIDGRYLWPSSQLQRIRVGPFLGLLWGSRHLDVWEDGGIWSSVDGPRVGVIEKVKQSNVEEGKYKAHIYMCV
jgi:hypothetical protein